ncbi:acyl-CoA desaturase [uncultured Nocardioides sp.]|jgi:linoleoyl-CoA desaturase|uniref:fatty acid desaturase family protein n=1 Tax=uncultured Nocardioides sp. TaxID=198441 RepID=UPI000C69EDB2|nr:acyl-CoA desaturase [uncultured Nocardioides sp.]MAY95235.1 acyl-CoA desaturase [Nocardioides sp.]MCK5930048.1 acyl-CoA desaturase [Nocardioides sp.]|tara:strand:+ start:3421 stop:4656 length:1236 start_codon:yes stop_codon:yes gene_type:complete
MAISDVAEYMHLTDEQVEELGRELDKIREEVEASRGADDAAYINKMIKVQRGLATAGRLTLMLTPHSRRTRIPGAVAGAALLGVAKILENMEIGHNVMHGQWDWMNDPEIHSSNWEWDTAQPAEQWKHSHNYIHHQFTNVLGYDNDIGYGILRMAREQKWNPANLGQPVYNALLATLFQWGVALHDLDVERIRKREKDPQEMKRQLRQILRKGRNQILKDYIVYPALSGPQWRTTITANATANLTRNLWAYTIIFCGHFPDGAMHFTEEEIEDETRAEWYLRQILGAANFEGGPLLHILSGNLGFQIEHHLFPDLPSNRYADISVRVKELCAQYDIPYTIGPLHKQYGQALRTIMKLSLPNRFTTSNKPPQPPTRPDSVEAPPVDKGRKSDAERPPRRSELGGWSRQQRAS